MQYHSSLIYIKVQLWNPRPRHTINVINHRQIAKKCRTLIGGATEGDIGGLWVGGWRRQWQQSHRSSSSNKATRTL